MFVWIASPSQCYGTPFNGLFKYKNISLNTYADVAAQCTCCYIRKHNTILVLIRAFLSHQHIKIVVELNSNTAWSTQKLQWLIAGCLLTVSDFDLVVADILSATSLAFRHSLFNIYCNNSILHNIMNDEWMNENARILSAFENRLRA